MTYHQGRLQTWNTKRYYLFINTIRFWWYFIHICSRVTLCIEKIFHDLIEDYSNISHCRIETSSEYWYLSGVFVELCRIKWWNIFFDKNCRAKSILYIIILEHVITIFHTIYYRIYYREPVDMYTVCLCHKQLGHAKVCIWDFDNRW